MDPNQLAIVLGLLTNGLYSLILFTGHKVGREVEDLAFREENIQECLTKNKTIFASIVEGAFKELPPVIEQKEFCEFLNFDQTKDIVGRIYSFDVFASENSYSLESVRSDFIFLLSQYFNGREGVSAVAPQLFSILITCCQKSLETIITEKQDLSAVDAKLTLHFKHQIMVLGNYHDNLYREIKSNQESLNELHIKFNEFDHKIKNGINELPQRIKLELQGCSFTPSFINMAPDPEDGFIQRDTEYEKLIEGLLINQSDAAVAITCNTALRGAGGYGKTTLAKVVCQDQRIIEKYSDGILWVTLGENPKNLIGHIQDLIYRLSNKRPEFEGLDAAASYFRDLLQEKHLLIVIDDVWDSSHLEPFIQGESGCVRLITTRINEVLPEGTLEVRVDTMKNEEAAKLLLSGISCVLSWAENQKIDELAKRLGYWPLLLKMVNSALRQHIERGKSFKESLDYVNYKLNKKNLTAFDSKSPKKRTQAVEATISVSFDLLDEDELERYMELAIFPEDEEIHLNTVEKLWGKTADYNCFDVEDLCYKFFNLSLLQTYDEDKNFIRLHDVMRDYLNDKYQQKIHFIHSQFLDAYEIETWADLPEEESYLWKSLSYHLVRAGRKSELKKLLLDFNWIQSKLNATDVHFLLNDYDFFADNLPFRLIQGAIILSTNALLTDKAQLGGQLLGRLQLFSEEEILSLVKQIWNPKNSQMILPLTSSLNPPGGALINMFVGHSDTIWAISITSDGKTVITGSEDRTVKVWNLKTGKEIHTLEGHSSAIMSVSITPNGKYAASGSVDGILKVWDVESGKEIHTLEGHSGIIWAAPITPDDSVPKSSDEHKTKNH